MDKIIFLDTLKRYKDISHYQIFGYCLMDNHIHLLMKECEESISQSLKRISSSYVYRYNKKYERCGHLFQERFKSENVESNRYFLTVLRYIHQNPVKALLVKNLFNYKWSSANEYISENFIVDIDPVLDILSSERKNAIKLYTKYMLELSDDECLDDGKLVKHSDSDVVNYLNELGIPHVSMLQQLEKTKRDSILVILKELDGISIRQLSRVTGISKSVISRAR